MWSIYYYSYIVSRGTFFFLRKLCTCLNTPDVGFSKGKKRVEFGVSVLQPTALSLASLFLCWFNAPFKSSREINVSSKLLNCEWNLNSGEFSSPLSESKQD